MSTCADVGSVIESKTSVVQISNVGFTSEVSNYLVVHTGPEGEWEVGGWEEVGWGRGEGREVGGGGVSVANTRVRAKRRRLEFYFFRSREAGSREISLADQELATLR